MKEVYTDILIIGAGPAGLGAALEASKRDVRVLVLEKEKALAVKPCAEAISAATLKEIGIEASGRLIRNRVDRVLVYAPNERKYVEITSSMRGEGYIIDKKELLVEMARRAVRQGAELWMMSRPVDFKVSGNIIKEVKAVRPGEEVIIKPKIVIGCDGVNSVVARKFFERKNYETIPCMQYIMLNVNVKDPHTIEIWVGRRFAPRGYLWFFPRGADEVNVGVGVRDGNPKDYLDKFIKMKQDRFKRAAVIEVGAAPVPVGGQIDRRVKGNVMLCGDAAGQVIPLTGAGIHSSIAAGRMAGRVAANAILEENVREEVLKAYESEYDEYWGRRIALSLKALRAIEKLSDEELDMLAEVLSGEDILDLANGLNLVRVATKLLRHPVFAVRLAKALL
ncbi:MAG: hypothetical protein DRN15_00640 [Thermoprotei archaeon]|nr:MAG: hypothetical protein DRM97_07000 [Thermoprotei archaeon]RLF25196.1 MAG: hypothetical protein DRN15_00640 [Thermoprotei archaeon]